MKNVNLKDFLLNYNFRKCNENNEFGTSIVRIYLDDDSDNWIQFGLYDFDGAKENRLISSLRTEILTKNVSYYYYDEDYEVFCIFLESEV